MWSRAGLNIRIRGNLLDEERHKTRTHGVIPNEEALIEFGGGILPAPSNCEEGGLMSCSCEGGSHCFGPSLRSGKPIADHPPRKEPRLEVNIGVVLGNLRLISAKSFEYDVIAKSLVPSYSPVVAVCSSGCAWAEPSVYRLPRKNSV